MYTIKEVSQKLDLSYHTIRYYTDIGLVPAVERDEHNNRLFSEQALNWLQGIKNLKRSGMSIKLLQKYVALCLDGEGTTLDRYDIILKQKEIIAEKLAEIQECADFLASKQRYYEEVLAGKQVDRTNPNNW